MNIKIQIGLLFFILVIGPAIAVNITLSLPNSNQMISIDSYNEGENLYIHLPSLIMKVNGTIGIQGNFIKIIANNKDINIDLQNNIASINELSTTKLIKFQNTIKLWQDTVWIEMNDAKTLIKYILGGDLEVKEELDERKKTDEEIGELNKPQTQDTKENPHQDRDEEKEISERNLLEDISPVKEDIIQKKENKFTFNNIFVDAGHGGEDSGIKFPSGKYEKEITLLFSINLIEQMKKNNIKVIISRENDTNKSTKERCNDIINGKADFFFTIHTEFPQREKEGLRIFVSKHTNNDINNKNNYIADEIIKTLRKKYPDITIEKLFCPLLLSDYTNIPGMLIEIFPKSGDNPQEEKWDTFLSKKSDIYTLIIETINKVKNSKEISQ